MMWVSWRRIRLCVFIIGTLMFASSVLLIVSARSLRQLTYLDDPEAWPPPNFGATIGVALGSLALSLVPVAGGTILGALSTAWDSRARAHPLIFGQSISRSRWFVTRILVAAASIVAVVFLVALCTCAVATYTGISTRFADFNLSSAGCRYSVLQPLSDAMLGLATGALAGVLLKRVGLAALVATVATALMCFVAYTLLEVLHPSWEHTVHMLGEFPFVRFGVTMVVTLLVTMFTWWLVTKRHV